MATLDLAWRMLCVLTAHKPTHGHVRDWKIEQYEFWSELRHNQATVVVLDGLCMVHGRVIWAYRHYAP